MYFTQFQEILDFDASKDLDLSNESEVLELNHKFACQLFYGIVLNRLDKRIVVSFRGTSSNFDVVDDIQVIGADV